MPKWLIGIEWDQNLIAQQIKFYLTDALFATSQVQIDILFTDSKS